MNEGNGEYAMRVTYEEFARMSLYERQRAGWSNWQDLNVGLFYDSRNGPEEQPGRCAPIMGRDLLDLLIEPEMG